MEAPSKIWRTYIENKTPFASWITVEKINFTKLQQEYGKGEIDFDTWLNKKYEINGRNAWFADGDTVIDENQHLVDDMNTTEGKNKWIGWLNNAADWVNDFSTEVNKTESGQQNPDLVETSNKVFGIPKVLFWGGTAAILWTAAILIGKGVKNLKKK